MKTQVLFLGILLLGSMGLFAQNEITVVVPNVKSIQGTMMICLVAKESDFLKDCARGTNVKIEGKETTAIFTDIPEGDYAITLFQDKNNDGALNTNFIGIPKEPYGFSNNPSSMFGPPSYDKCIFKVDGNKTITVEL